MKILLIATFIVFVIVLISCSNKNSKNSAMNNAELSIKPLVIEKYESGEGGDLKLSIIESIQSGKKYYKVNSTYEGKNLGFEIIIGKSREGLILKKIDGISDNFLQVLCDLYGVKQTKKLTFVDSVRITYIDLDEFAKSIRGNTEATDIRKYKLFFEGEEESAEWYLNINEKEHWVEIREKDDAYREAIIGFLSKH